MARLRLAASAALLFVFSFPVVAADFNGMSAAGCGVSGQSSMHLLPEAEIEQRVWAYYDESAAALHDASVVGSRSPAFLWASETKFQCGKAIGYLNGGTIDDVSIQNCDCFYGRFVTFR